MNDIETTLRDGGAVRGLGDVETARQAWLYSGHEGEESPCSRLCGPEQANSAGIGDSHRHPPPHRGGAGVARWAFGNAMEYNAKGDTFQYAIRPADVICGRGLSKHAESALTGNSETTGMESER
jgi:hypothetical protein